jgi:L-fucose isomerase-like protein
MDLRKPRAAFVGFGEVNSPRDLIEAKCAQARRLLEDLGLEVLATPPVSDEAAGLDEARALADLQRADFDLLVVCLAGWIPSHSVVDVVSPYAHKPMVLWGLTGQYQQDGRLVTTADQAGTTALRDVFDALGFRFKYVYDTPDAPYAAAPKVARFAAAARAAALLRGARIGMMGYRDMKLHATLADAISLRRVIGAEIEVFETLEVMQRMAAQDATETAWVADAVIADWKSDRPLSRALLEPSVRLYLAVMERVRERHYLGVMVAGFQSGACMEIVPLFISRNCCAMNGRLRVNVSG